MKAKKLNLPPEYRLADFSEWNEAGITTDFYACCCNKTKMVTIFKKHNIEKVDKATIDHEIGHAWCYHLGLDTEYETPAEILYMELFAVLNEAVSLNDMKLLTKLYIDYAAEKGMRDVGALLPYFTALVYVDTFIKENKIKKVTPAVYRKLAKFALDKNLVPEKYIKKIESKLKRRRR